MAELHEPETIDLRVADVDPMVADPSEDLSIDALTLSDAPTDVPTSPSGAPIEPLLGERTFAELPIEWQIAALERERRLRQNVEGYLQRRRRRALQAAAANAIVFALASFGLGTGGLMFRAMIALAGAVAGASVAWFEQSAPRAVITCGASMIATHMFAAGLHVCEPSWATGFFVWLLVTISGRFTAEWAEAKNAGF